MIEVLVVAPFGPDLMDKLRTISKELSVKQINIGDREWPEGQEVSAEVLYASATFPHPDQAPNLSWVQLHWAGIDHLVRTPMWQSEVTITTASGIHAPNIGQYVLAQMLAWANRVPRWLDHQRRREWPTNGRWNTFLPTELRGQTVGVLGYGSIGREVARLAKSFGMTVLATKRDARSTEDNGYIVPGTGDQSGYLADRIYPPEAVRSMVAGCDFVVVTLPLTEQTRGAVNDELLAAMKESSFLINVGRGQLVDEPALVKALQRGQIAGAGLDVFQEEPLPEDSPLWAMENVIISPHVSGFTPHYDERATDLFAENLRRYLDGKPLLNEASRSAGY
jgi:phosphoglycerate dehydrogenase-like enzyme